MTYSEYDYPRRLTTHEVCFEINDKPVYVRILDKNDDLSDRQLKSQAWKYLKESSRVEIRRNI
jgi:hypothetical protein